MKIGIVSTSRVIDMFWEAYPDMQGIEVSAICCRPQSVQKARHWAAQYSIPDVYTDYAQFLQQGDFDFVYNGTINSRHFVETKQALLAHRNVILEKPFTTTLTETNQLCALAQQNGVWLFEAITTIHLPAMQFLRQQLPQLGAVRAVQANFSAYSSRYASFLAGEQNPTFDPAHAGGALYDMNIYNLHLVVGLLGVPAAVQYYPNKGWNGIDTSGTAVLQYDGCVAALTAAKDGKGLNGMALQAENGQLVVAGDPNACPGSYAIVNGERREGPLETRHRMTYEFEAFAALYAAKDTQKMQQLLRHTQAVMQTLQRLRDSIT